MSLIAEFLDQQVYAIVGASQDRSKFGFKIYATMKRKGYEVYPVNPNTHNIMGDTCYRSLADLPKKPDVVDIVLEPDKGKGIVEECHQLGIGRVWLQPGAESPSLIKKCEELGIQVVHGACLMTEAPDKAGN